ncbi:MAG TPA: type II secretion system F family protein [Casimicrobiaceae bacterium]|nr:type II secretion system F family protein [Casimicrobiaceae bacterium]
MDVMQILFLALLFVAVFGLVFFALSQFLANPVRDRLEVIGGGRELRPERPPSQWVQRIVKLTGPLARLSVPEEGWEGSAVRTHFMNAGFRNPSAPVIYFAAKTALALLFPALLYLYVSTTGSKLQGNTLLAALLVVAAVGYYLPNIILRRLVFVRQREIFETFPDALDLMTICVEAGLAMDAAIARVADEIKLTSPVLSEELHLVTLELRAGASKEKALRNLALRTGVEDVDILVAMLIQAERFGTSIGASLRVHADGLRTKRRQRAEEAAAKIALKLLFPLIFCIFPSLLLVLLGPAFIQIYRILLPSLAGQR